MGQTDPIDTFSGVRELHAPDQRVTRLCIPGLPHEVELHDSDEVIDALRTVMPGWTLIDLVGSVPRGTPITVIRRDDKGRYSFHSWWARKPLKKLGLAGATCGAVADLSQAFLDARPGILGLHCGALQIAGHLFALTGTYRAGKTTLVTRLGAEPDLNLFCDDILPVTPDGQGLALGIQPRLRLPLPDGVTSGFQAFVDRNLTIHDARYGYVDCPVLADHGTRAPLTAIIVLKRVENAPATLHHMDVAEAAGHLIRQNIADPCAADTHYDQIAELAHTLTCLKLQYSDIEQAIHLLMTAFDGPDTPAVGVDILPPLPPDVATPEHEPADLSLHYQRKKAVIPRAIGADTFLWQMEDRHFYSLNTIATAIWHLLETPITGEAIVSILQDAFPDADAGVIGRDAAVLLAEFQSRNLVKVSASQ